MPFGRTVTLLLTWVTCGGMEALCGAATALTGEVRLILLWSNDHNIGNLTLEGVGQSWSSEVISLFLEDWEVGRVA